jgi:hypothetical protein
VAQLNKEGLNMMEKGLTLMQRVAICFAAGVIGGLAVVLFSHSQGTSTLSSGALHVTISGYPDGYLISR